MAPGPSPRRASQSSSAIAITFPCLVQAGGRHRQPPEKVGEHLREIGLANFLQLVSRADDRLVDRDETPEIDWCANDDDVTRHAVDRGFQIAHLLIAVPLAGNSGNCPLVRSRASGMMFAQNSGSLMVSQP